MNTQAWPTEFADCVLQARFDGLDLFRRRAKQKLPHLSPGRRIYAFGDIHGRLDLLNRVLEAVESDLRSDPVPDPTFVFLGDYIDRGADSAGVLDRLIEVRTHFPSVCLKGNHESFMLETMIDASLLANWLAAGGTNTLLSYGITPPQQLNRDTEAELVSAFSARVPETHRSFLRSLPLSMEIDDYLFVHAGLRPKVPLAMQTEEDLLWIRDEFLLFEGAHEKYVVHGHTPVMQPDIRPNRANIDTGAYATSRLTCLALEGSLKRIIC